MPPNPNRPGRLQSIPQINHSINNNAPSASVIFPIVTQPTTPNIFLPPETPTSTTPTSTTPITTTITTPTITTTRTRSGARQRAQINRQNRINQQNRAITPPIITPPIDTSTTNLKTDDTSSLTTPTDNKNLYLIGGAALIALLVVAMNKR